MKLTILTCLCSIALCLPAFGQSQTPAPSPTTSGTAGASASAGASIAPAATVTPEDEDSIERSVSRKLKRHFNVTTSPTVTVTRHNRDRDHDFDGEDGALMAIPIIAIIFSMVFGAPVLIVAAIMFFSYLRSRSLHRTVREMVEKGQPVPATLFAPPAAVKARSDMRRGVVLIMVGIGIMIFFGAVNDWDGGAWALGIIPFLIGVGHLIVWKLEGPKEPDKAPPLP
jgi:Domain of unknown function (DUF6249)